jgi:hypothetical protein
MKKKKKNDLTPIAIVVGAVVIAFTLYQSATHEHRMKESGQWPCEGEKDQWTNCEATSKYRLLRMEGEYIEYEDGEYAGQWKDGKPDGHGTWTSGIGDEYVGEWKDNKRHGQGASTWPHVHKYVGEWKDGKWHGQGTRTWPDGGKYVGEWKDRQRSGQGTYTSANGNEYVGQWKDDYKHGKGALIYPDGKVVKGIWKDGELFEVQ